MTAPDQRIPPLPFAEWDNRRVRPCPATSSGPNSLNPVAATAPCRPCSATTPATCGWASRGCNSSNELMTDPLLDPRYREILVLRVSWRTRSSYEWHQHVRLGQQFGLSTDHVQAVIEGPDATLWTPVERALVTAADE